MIIKEIKVKNYLTKSNLPGIDFTINPYIGCSHKCRYCYASFMKKITNHSENWGNFIDIKLTEEEVDLKKIQNKTIFLSSVTDPYLSFEKEYLITRSILEDDMEKASSIKERIKTLKILHENNISTVAFISPIFPYITDIKDIIESVKDYVDFCWFENLKLRANYKKDILNYIKDNYKELYPKYLDIYFNENMSYFKNLSLVIKDICSKYNIKYEIFWDKKEDEKNLKQESFNLF